MKRGVNIALVIAGVLAIAFMNYELALMGEPRSVWLMTKLGLM